MPVRAAEAHNDQRPRGGWDAVAYCRADRFMREMMAGTVRFGLLDGL